MKNPFLENFRPYIPDSANLRELTARRLTEIRTALTEKLGEPDSGEPVVAAYYARLNELVSGHARGVAPGVLPDPAATARVSGPTLAPAGTS